MTLGKVHQSCVLSRSFLQTDQPCRFGLGKEFCIGRTHRRPKSTDADPLRGPRAYWSEAFSEVSDASQPCISAVPPGTSASGAMVRSLPVHNSAGFTGCSLSLRRSGLGPSPPCVEKPPPVAPMSARVRASEVTALGHPSRSIARRSRPHRLVRGTHLITPHPLAYSALYPPPLTATSPPPLLRRVLVPSRGGTSLGCLRKRPARVKPSGLAAPRRGAEPLAGGGPSSVGGAAPLAGGGAFLVGMARCRSVQAVSGTRRACGRGARSSIGASQHKNPSPLSPCLPRAPTPPSPLLPRPHSLPRPRHITRSLPVPRLLARSTPASTARLLSGASSSRSWRRSSGRRPRGRSKHARFGV